MIINVRETPNVFISHESHSSTLNALDPAIITSIHPNSSSAKWNLFPQNRHLVTYLAKLQCVHPRLVAMSGVAQRYQAAPDEAQIFHWRVQQPFPAGIDTKSAHYRVQIRPEPGAPHETVCVHRHFCCCTKNTEEICQNIQWRDRRSEGWTVCGNILTFLLPCESGVWEMAHNFESRARAGAVLMVVSSINEN